MPYVPYARQDRVCVPGESFSIKAFAALINMLAFDRVIVVDPHSDVVAAVIARVMSSARGKSLASTMCSIDAGRGHRCLRLSYAGAKKKTG